jgi:hypothetical protein
MKITINIETDSSKELVERVLKNWLNENFVNKAEVEIE